MIATISEKPTVLKQDGIGGRDKDARQGTRHLDVDREDGKGLNNSSVLGTALADEGAEGPHKQGTDRRRCRERGLRDCTRVSAE
jgi:hypothetical protein